MQKVAFIIVFTVVCTIYSLKSLVEKVLSWTTISSTGVCYYVKIMLKRYLEHRVILISNEGTYVAVHQQLGVVAGVNTILMSNK